MYQGYENYPTWVMAVWIDNDRDVLSDVMEAAMRSLPDSGPDFSDVRLAEWLRQYTEERLPEGCDPISESLLNHVMNEVDWLGLARKYLKGDD